MKKKNNKGFVLTEVLVASTLVITTFVTLYVQLRRVINNFNNSFYYNTVDELYGADSIREYISLNGYNRLKSIIDNYVEPEELKFKYVDITDCSSDYFTNSDYCALLFESLEVKKVFFTSVDVSEIIIDNETRRIFSNNMVNYMKKITPINNDAEYRIVVEYKNDRYATLEFKV